MELAAWYLRKFSAELWSTLTDEVAQFVRQFSLSCGENLPANILENNRPRLQVHHQHGFELSLGSLQLHLLMKAQQKKSKRVFIVVYIDFLYFNNSFLLYCCVAELLPLLRCQPSE